MKFNFSMLAVAYLLTSLGAAQAQSNAPEKFYGGLEVGRTSIADQTGDTNSSLVSLFGGSASATQDSSMNDFRIFGGYKLNENVNFELGYLKTSSLGLNFSGVTSGSNAYTGSLSLKYSGFDYSVLLRPNISTGLNNMFFRLGGHSLKGDVDFTVTGVGGTASISDSVSGTGTLFGIGYDINIAKNIDVRVSANRLNKIGGQSDGSATIYSLGVFTRF
jgi:hypothetical protein